MKILLKPSYPFNLDVTLCCGQAFRWDKQGEWWYGIVGRNVFKIRQINDKLEFENVDTRFVRDYFGLNDDLSKILSEISRDTHIKRAIDTFYGLRILHQNPWECLISYVCATYKNIQAIKQMLLNLSRRFGEKICFDEYKFYSFPIAQKLAKAKLQELVACGLGYRAKYVSETAKMICENGFELESLGELGYEQARKELLNFSGVGLKVADCVLLFSLGKSEAFPIDVWIKRAVLKHYSNHFPNKFIKKILDKQSLNDSEYRKLSLFGRKYFGEYAGYAQEYLYHYERTQS
ncbi:8-oxoguanine DNA glycosylase [Candidatus Bathyarchaeota archaeon]|nr:8-oxoguanine DNA glycosylase [Candidatus Bathyarchaeota archaeon]